MTKLEQAARQACQTPLKDLLRSVPKDGRDCYEEDSTCHHFIPYGRLIHEALAEIERLEALAEQAEQEPVAWNDLTEEEIDKLVDDRQTAVGGYIETHAEALVDDVIELFKLKNAAPVRTKDLTDVEVEKVWRKHGGYMVMPIDFARAVIAADREKNK